MAATKPPKLIAADILRRFLVDYRALLVEYRQQFDRDTAYRGQTTTLFDELVTLSKGWIQPDRVDGRSSDRSGRLYGAPGEFDAVNIAVEQDAGHDQVERQPQPLTVVAPKGRIRIAPCVVEVARFERPAFRGSSLASSAAIAGAVTS